MLELFKLFITFLMGFITAVFSEPIRKYFERTKINVTFNIEEDVVLTPDGSTSNAYYVRLRLHNTGARTFAKHLNCFLIMIERQEDSAWERIFDVPLSLAWSYQGHIGPIDLAPKMWVFFDILKFQNVNNRIEPATKGAPLLWKTNLNPIGKYRFTYCVAGENIASQIKGSIVLEWNGSWDNFEVKEHTRLL